MTADLAVSKNAAQADARLSINRETSISTMPIMRLAGWTLTLGAAAYVVLTLGGDVLGGQGSSHFTSPLYAPVSTLQAVAGFTLVLGLTGHYARQHARAGKLGLVGFVPLIASLSLYAFALPLMSALIFAWLAGQPAGRALLGPNSGPPGLLLFFMISTVLNVVGIACYGIATWRAGVFSKAAAAVLIAGAALALLGFVIGSSSESLPAWVSDLPGLVFIAALGWLGLELGTELNRPEASDLGTSA